MGDGHAPLDPFRRRRSTSLCWWISSLRQSPAICTRLQDKSEGGRIGAGADDHVMCHVRKGREKGNATGDDQGNMDDVGCR
jgi:hypothetical protein